MEISKNNVKSSNISAFIFATGDFHNLMAQNAKKSFQKFHPNIPIKVVDDMEFENFLCSEFKKGNSDMPVALLKQVCAYEYMINNDIDKMIMLGADTVTCGRLDNFINKNDCDIVLTACYPYQIQKSYLRDQIKYYKNFHFSYVEFGSLNFAVQHGKYRFAFADLKPSYKTSDVVYNSRAKEDQFNPQTKSFKVLNSKLYTRDDKQIKVYHFQEQFTHGVDKYDFDETINRYKNIMKLRLNKETIEYFKDVVGIDIIEIDR